MELLFQDRPYVPALYISGASLVLVMLFVYRPATTWPGLAIVIIGAGVYAVLGLTR